jgi:hypothetical protein
VSRSFRPRGGWRSGVIFAELREIEYMLVGWGWMLWGVDWFRPRAADRIVTRIASRARAGDIIVMHDADDSAPRKDLCQAVEGTACADALTPHADSSSARYHHLDSVSVRRRGSSSWLCCSWSSRPW